MKDIESIISEITKRVEVLLEYRGIKIMDSQTAILLKLVDKHGSILKASISAGIPYSKAWEMITRIEKALGIRIVEKKRGGMKRGGTRLTDAGRRLLEYYEELQRKNIGATMFIERNIDSLPDLIVMGSHDLLLERILYYISSKYQANIQKAWIGSCGGILAIMTNESDIAGIHLFNQETMTYNKGIIEKYGLSGSAILVRGYDRELVFAYNPYYSYNELEDLITDIIDGKIRVVNRNRGSGTRILFDKMLKETAKRKGKLLLYDRIKGYSIEVQTHQEVVEYIASGKADAGLTLTHLAEAYGLKYIAVTREQYDFLVNNNSSGKRLVRAFINTLREKAAKIAVGLKGYHISENIGKPIE